MVKIIKRGGKLQDFSKAKLAKSIKNAGYNNADECSNEIAKKIRKKSRVKSSDIAKMVVAEIKNNALKIVRNYATYRAKHSKHAKKKKHVKHVKHKVHKKHAKKKKK